MNLKFWGTPVPAPKITLTDSEIIDWLEEYRASVFFLGSGSVVVKFTLIQEKEPKYEMAGESHGKTLREAVLAVVNRIALREVEKEEK